MVPTGKGKAEEESGGFGPGGEPLGPSEHALLTASSGQPEGTQIPPLREHRRLALTEGSLGTGHPEVPGQVF